MLVSQGKRRRNGFLDIWRLGVSTWCDMFLGVFRRGGTAWDCTVITHWHRHCNQYL